MIANLSGVSCIARPLTPPGNGGIVPPHLRVPPWMGSPCPNHPQPPKIVLPVCPEKKGEKAQASVAVAITACCFLMLVGIPFAWISTKEWRRDIDGRSKLAEARNSSKVKTERARADVESAKLNAKAEIARARGTAKAVAIENGTITPSYVNYLYVKNLAKARVVYVPTEAGLPILEAGK